MFISIEVTNDERKTCSYPHRNPTTTTAATRQSREAVSPTLRAKDVAAAHLDVVADIRRKLEERGVSLPASHFADVDVELARYAITVGLLSAQTAADRCITLASVCISWLWFW